MFPKKQTSMYTVQRRLRSGSHNAYMGVMNELFQLYESFDFVKTLQGYFRSGRFDLAVTLADSLSEQKYSDATMHFVANQFAALIRKYPWDPKVVKTDPESQAVSKFLTSERKCFLLNRKFGLYASLRNPYDVEFERMRKFINYTVGESPSLSSVYEGAAFGAGASVGVHGNATNLQRKLLCETWSVTPGAVEFGFSAIVSDPHLRDLILDSREGISCIDFSTAKARFKSKIRIAANNKISFVPKTAKTHRAIAVEPLLNGYIQKGIDLLMRKHLKRIGIDLNDQSLNQRMAHSGSMDDSDESFVTIDLSSASDSISIGLARLVLPPDWFILLNHTRSPRYEFRGKSFTYHKFCSMGNGFCFPLETLLFTACCFASGCGKPGTDFSVYGDDIVVRKKHAVKVLSLLRVMGFSPNVSKTFLEGPFRESCGADWYTGKDVRPYILDYSLDSLESLFKWLNLTRRNQLTTDFFESVRPYVLGLIPHRYRFFRPHKGNADSGIDSWADEHLSSPHCFFDRRKQLWMCKTLVHKPVLDKGWARDAYRRDSVDMYSALIGSRPENYQVSYSFRRKTKTKVAITGYSGATATDVAPHIWAKITRCGPTERSA